MVVKESIKELTEVWNEVLMKSVPSNRSEIINGMHIGMFKIHGHRIDEITALIRGLNE